MIIAVRRMVMLCLVMIGVMVMGVLALMMQDERDCSASQLCGYRVVAMGR
jgi:hypothetical protein